METDQRVRRQHYFLRDIDGDLWARIKAKVRAEGRAGIPEKTLIRDLIEQLFREWIKE